MMKDKTKTGLLGFSIIIVLIIVVGIALNDCKDKAINTTKRVEQTKQEFEIELKKWELQDSNVPSIREKSGEN